MGVSTNLMFGSTNACLMFGINLDEELPEHLDADDDLTIGLPDEPKLVIEQHCSGDYPCFILGYPSSYIEAKRGFPYKFNPLDLKDYSPTLILDYCQKNNIEIIDRPSWLLFSYWG